MDRDGVHQRYGIPFAVLEKYENAKVQIEGTLAIYDDSAIGELGLIMSFLDFGFSWDEITCYMQMKNDGNYRDCLVLLSKKRNSMLEEIHKKEKLISRIDYLKYEMKKSLV